MPACPARPGQAQRRRAAVGSSVPAPLVRAARARGAHVGVQLRCGLLCRGDETGKQLAVLGRQGLGHGGANHLALARDDDDALKPTALLQPRQRLVHNRGLAARGRRRGEEARRAVEEARRNEIARRTRPVTGVVARTTASIVRVAATLTSEPVGRCRVTAGGGGERRRGENETETERERERGRGGGRERARVRRARELDQRDDSERTSNAGNMGQACSCLGGNSAWDARAAAAGTSRRRAHDSTSGRQGGGGREAGGRRRHRAARGRPLRAAAGRRGA